MFKNQNKFWCLCPSCAEKVFRVLACEDDFEGFSPCGSCLPVVARLRRWIGKPGRRLVNCGHLTGDGLLEIEWVWEHDLAARQTAAMRAQSHARKLPRPQDKALAPLEAEPLAYNPLPEYARGTPCFRV